MTLTSEGHVAVKEASLEDEAQYAGAAHPLLLPPCHKGTAVTMPSVSVPTRKHWKLLMTQVPGSSTIGVTRTQRIKTGTKQRQLECAELHRGWKLWGAEGELKT